MWDGLRLWAGLSFSTFVVLVWVVLRWLWVVLTWLRFGVVLCCVWCIDVRVWWYDVFAATLVGNRLVLWVSGVLFFWVGFK